VVTQIANTANVQGITTDQVTNFEVRIFLLEDSYKDLLTNTKTSPFRPGMSTTVEILTNTKQNILTIPILAVTTRIDTLKKVEEWEKVEERTEPSNSEPVNVNKPKEVVFIAKGDTARMVEVKPEFRITSTLRLLKG